MQKKKNLVNLIPILFTLIIVWLFFFLSKATIENNNKNITSHIPQDTEWTLELNTHQLIEKGVQSVLFSQIPDKELNQLINNIVINQQGNDVSFEKLGLNFNSNTYLFKLNNKGDEFICGLFEISNPKEFSKNIAKTLPDNLQAFNNEDVGLIIHGTGDKTDIANEILNTNNSSKLLSEYPVHFSSPILSTELNLSILDSSILFNGRFLLSKAKLSPSLSLIPEGFHFTSRFIPTKISDSICTFLKIESNSLLGLSMNHTSSELVSKSKVLLKLNSSFLFHFENPISIKEQLLRFSKEANYISVDSNSFSIGDDAYFYHQVTSNSFYISDKAFNSSYLVERKDVFYMKGVPEKLTNVKGKGITRRFLNIIPLFHASETFANSIETVQISSGSSLNNSNRFTGEIVFKNGKKSMNEMMRFVILLNL